MMHCFYIARKSIQPVQTFIKSVRKRSTKAVEEACDVFEKSFKEKTLSSSHMPDDVILQFRPPKVRFSHLPRGHLNFMLQDYLGLSVGESICLFCLFVCLGFGWLVGCV